MAFTNDRKAAIKKLKNLVLNVIHDKYDIEQFRTKLNSTFKETFLPNKVELDEHDYGEVKCDVLSPEIYSSRRVLFYIHGGSFVGGSRVAWRSFCARLAHKSYSRVVVPEISLSPESSFAETVKQLNDTFRLLYNEELVSCLIDVTEKNKNPKPEIILAADGSGAATAFSFLCALDESQRMRINRIVFISPWLNFSHNSFAMNAKKNADEVFSSDALKKCFDLSMKGEKFPDELVALTEMDAEHLKERFKNFPPIYIQVGESEMMLPDIENFVAHIKSAGVECTVEVFPKMMFMFQMADEFLWEAQDALKKLGDVIAGDEGERKASIAENKPPLERSFRHDA